MVAMVMLIVVLVPSTTWYCIYPMMMFWYSRLVKVSLQNYQKYPSEGRQQANHQNWQPERRIAWTRRSLAQEPIILPLLLRWLSKLASMFHAEKLTQTITRKPRSNLPRPCVAGLHMPVRKSGNAKYLKIRIHARSFILLLRPLPGRSDSRPTYIPNDVRRMRVHVIHACYCTQLIDGLITRGLISAKYHTGKAYYAIWYWGSTRRQKKMYMPFENPHCKWFCARRCMLVLQMTWNTYISANPPKHGSIL